jgi:hypothetical protein
MKAILKLSTVALALGVLSSCTASTKLSSSWVDPTAPSHQFSKIVVVGVAQNAGVRRKYEDAFVKDLHSRGVNAVPSYQVLGEGRIDKDAAAAKLSEQGVDGVVVTRLVDQQTVNTYYPPTYSSVAAPSAYYGGWYGYYNMGYMSSPGYYSEDKVYRVETNLYDLKNDKLMWSGLTDTTLPAGDAPESQVQSLINTIVYDMEKKQAIPKSMK